jgi:hypothetical protein
MGQGLTIASGIILGIGIGTYIPAFPFPLAALNSYVGLILIIIGIILLIMSK